MSDTIDMARRAVARRRIQAAKSGDLKLSPESLARAAAADRRALAEMNNPAPSKPNPFIEALKPSDALKTMAAGVGRGIASLIDLPGEITAGAMGGAAIAADKMGAEQSFVEGLRSANPFPRGRVREGLKAVTRGGSEYQGDGSAVSRYAGTIGEFLPGGALAKAPVVAGALPGILSEFAGDLTEGKEFPDSWPIIGGHPVEPSARLTAAVAAPSAANGIRRLITPYPSDPARVAAAGKLASEGVDTTAGQVTGRESLKYREALSGRTAQLVADQNQQFTRAALRRIGADADRATPEVMRAAQKRIGDLFGDVTSEIIFVPRPTALDAAKKVVKDYRSVTAKNNLSPIIQNISGNLKRSFAIGKPISGQQYKNWRSQLSKLTVGTDKQLADAAGDMIDVLDDAVEASLESAKKMTVLEDFAEARQQWRDYLAIEGVVARAGENAAAGIISPQTLRNEVARQGKREYVSGGRDLADLARAGATVTADLPKTGAWPRGLQGLQAAGSGTGAGFLASLLTNDPVISATAGIAGLAAPYARNALAASKAGQAYLKNQLAVGAAPGGIATLPALTEFAN